jgi:hypothetical protein
VPPSLRVTRNGGKRLIGFRARADDVRLERREVEGVDGLEAARSGDRLRIERVLTHDIGIETPDLVEEDAIGASKAVSAIGGRFATWPRRSKADIVVDRHRDEPAPRDLGALGAEDGDVVSPLLEPMRKVKQDVVIAVRVPLDDRCDDGRHDRDSHGLTVR